MISPKHPNSFVISFLSPLPLIPKPPPQLRSAYMGIAMMGVMHVYFKFTQPLFIQALMGIKNLYDAKPVAIHILGRPATGSLKRPFKTASMFGGECFPPFFVNISCPHFFVSPWIAAAGPQTDAAAIAEAEKQVGKKEE